MLKTILSYTLLGIIWSQLITACIKNGLPVQTERFIEPELLPYAEFYYDKLASVCKNSPLLRDEFISIKFVPDNSEWIGLCAYRINGFQILVNARYWYSIKTTDSERKLLIYHELSHCVLGQPHVEDIDDYMYPSVQPIPEEVFIKQVIRDMEKSCQ
jgi:hypothetical protein